MKRKPEEALELTIDKVVLGSSVMSRQRLPERVRLVQPRPMNQMRVEINNIPRIQLNILPLRQNRLDRMGFRRHDSVESGVDSDSGYLVSEHAPTVRAGDHGEAAVVAVSSVDGHPAADDAFRGLDWPICLVLLYME